MKLTTPLLTLAALLAAPLAAQANVVYSDNFDTANGGTASEWFTFTTSGSASDAVNGSAGTWTLTPQSGTSLSGITYFSPTSLAVGQSIELSFNFSYTVLPNTQGGFRFGLFNSNGSEISADQTASTGNAAFFDDRGYSNNVSLSSGAGHQTFLFERTTDHNTFWTTTAFTQLGSSVARTATAINTTYAASLLITYVDDNTVSITSTVNGVSFTRNDTASLRTAFDSLAFFTDGNNGNVTLSNIVVTAAIPEPSTYAILIGVVGLGLATGVRRNRS